MKLKNLNISIFKPEIVFLILGTIFGIAFIIITPPFQVPDEINHFYRAYQISQGVLTAEKKDQRIGGYIPESIIQITKNYTTMSWSINQKTNYQSIAENCKIPLKPENTEFVDFPNTGMYSPVSYIPQSLSIFILRKLNINPLIIFYGARFFTLFCWIVSIYFSIKTIPIYKWLFTIIALLPMSIFINMSLSADVVTNILSFLLISSIFKLAFNNQLITIKNFIFISILSILLAFAKLVYSPIILLFLLIPLKNFRFKNYRYFQFIILLIITILTSLLLSHSMSSLYTPYHSYNPKFRDNATLINCADMHLQMKYILSNGLYVFNVFIDSLIETFDMYYRGYIGTFGWLDTNLPWWLINASYFVLFFVAISENNKNIVIRFKHKLLIILCFTSMVTLILLSQHLTWDCVGGSIIATIQGRYFIPVFPLTFILFYNNKLNLSKIFIPILLLFTIFCLLYSIQTLNIRYFKIPSFDSITIKCNAEKINDNLYVTDNPSIFLENANSQSIEKSRSGKYSAKLTPSTQFGYTYRLYNCKRGDIINVEVWRYGKGGGIVISDPCANIYLHETESKEKDNLGWERLSLKYAVYNNLNNKDIGIYIYNNTKDTSYFDDFVIMYNKIQNK